LACLLCIFCTVKISPDIKAVISKKKQCVQKTCPTLENRYFAVKALQPVPIITPFFEWKVHHEFLPEIGVWKDKNLLFGKAKPVLSWL